MKKVHKMAWSDIWVIVYLQAGCRKNLVQWLIMHAPREPALSAVLCPIHIGQASECPSSFVHPSPLPSPEALPCPPYAGIILISLALCADAVIGNVQEKALKKHSASTVEMVLYSYSIGTVYILLWTFLSGSLLPAFLYCLEVSTVPLVLLLLVMR